MIRVMIETTPRNESGEENSLPVWNPAIAAQTAVINERMHTKKSENPNSAECFPMIIFPITLILRG